MTTVLLKIVLILIEKNNGSNGRAEFANMES